jgi:hypothetical protein
MLVCDDEAGTYGHDGVWYHGRGGPRGGQREETSKVLLRCPFCDNKKQRLKMDNDMPLRQMRTKANQPMGVLGRVDAQAIERQSSSRR